MTDKRRRVGDVHISGSRGVVVGPGTQHNYFGVPPRVVILVAVFVVAALVAVVGVVLYLKPWSAQPQVRLADYSVAPPTLVDATDFEVARLGDGPEKRTDTGTSKVAVTPVDITLKNDGAASAVIVDAVVTVEYAEHLDDCAATGGPLQVETNYDVRLPLNPKTRPFTVHRAMHFEVRPHTSERFTLTIGPDTQPGESWDARLYVADIALEADYSGEPVKVGRAGWVTRAGDGIENLDEGLGGIGQECLRKNAARVATFAALGAKRSDEANALLKRWSQLTGADGSVAQPKCWNPPSGGTGAALPLFCALYTRTLVYASVTLSEAPPDGRLLMLRLTGTDGETRRAVICRTRPKSDTNEVPLFAPGTPLSGFDACSDNEDGRSYFLWAFPDQPLNDDDLIITAQLLPADGGITDVTDLPLFDGTGAFEVHRTR